MVADRLLVDVAADGQVSVSSWLEGGLPEAQSSAPAQSRAPLDAAALEDLRWYLEDYLVAPFGVYGDRGGAIASRLRGWGEALFSAVFGPGPGRDVYTRLRARLGPGTEVIVRTAVPDVLGWPWELLWDPDRATPLALDLAGMSRSLPGEGLPSPFEVSGGVLRVLMVIARPLGGQDVGYRMVARPLLARLGAVRGQVELVVLRPPTVEALELALREARAAGRPFHVVHFDGHGVLTGRRASGGRAPNMFAQTSGDGFLVFEPSQDRGSARVSAAQFAVALKAAEVPLVVLNACQSGAMGDRVEAAIATRLLQEGIAAVVAMGYSVYAVAAAEFMAAFYERLFAGESVTGAVAAGRRRLFLRPERPSPKGELPLNDWMVPVQYLRREVHFPQLVRQPSAAGEVLSLDDRLDQLRERSHMREGVLAGVGEFVGRDAETYELERLARQKRVVVVYGPGGSGKTELAKAFGRWWRDTGGVERPEWIIWHSFEPGFATFGLNGAITTIGLRLFGPNFTRLNSEERRSVVVDALRAHRALVIWDNFETVFTMPDVTGATPPLNDTERDELRTFLAEVAAPGGTGTLIVTSRTPETWLGDVGRIRLGGLVAGERAEYTDQLLGDDPAIHERRADRAFGELLEWLDGHPLSMRLVLPHLATTSPEFLLGGLRGTQSLPASGDENDDRSTSLAASISYSFDHLSEGDRSLLVIVSLFHGVVDANVLAQFSTVETIPDRFQGIDRARWVAVLSDASNLGLLSPIYANLYQIHPALPAFLAALWRTNRPANDEQERGRAIDALLDAYVALAQWLDQQIQTGDASLAFAVIDQQRRNLGHFLGHAIATSQWVAADALVEPLNDYWDARGLASEARGWVDRVRAAVEAPDGAPPSLDHPAGRLWLFVVGADASRALHRGDLDTAEKTYTDTREMLKAQRRTRLQQSHLAVAANQLGSVAHDRGQLDEAEDWYRQSLAIKKELGDRFGQAHSLHHLGRVAHDRGQLDEAEDWYRQSLAIKKELGDRFGQAHSLHQLGRVAHHRGQLDEAEDWYRQSLAIVERLGDRHGRAALFDVLGALAQDRDQLDEAEDWYRQSLAIVEQLGSGPGRASSSRQLGQLALLRGKLDEAERWYRLSLAIGQDLGGQTGQSRSYQSLGNIALSRGQLDEAEDWYRRSLAIDEQTGSRPGLAASYGQLGIIAEERGSPEDALRWTIRCISLFDEFPHSQTGPGPLHLARLTGQLGMSALERCWREITAEIVPPAVERYIRRSLEDVDAPEGRQAAEDEL